MQFREFYAYLKNKKGLIIGTEAFLHQADLVAYIDTMLGRGYVTGYAMSDKTTCESRQWHRELRGCVPLVLLAVPDLRSAETVNE